MKITNKVSWYEDQIEVIDLGLGESGINGEGIIIHRHMCPDYGGYLVLYEDSSMDFMETDKMDFNFYGWLTRINVEVIASNYSKEQTL